MGCINGGGEADHADGQIRTGKMSVQVSEEEDLGLHIVNNGVCTVVRCVYLYLPSISLDFEELADGLYEALVVLVAHPLNVLFVHLDPVGQAVLEGLHLLSLVHCPDGTQLHDNGLSLVFNLYFSIFSKIRCKDRAKRVQR